MKFIVEVDPVNSPDAVGEFLRSQFFAKEMGCVDCFEPAPDVEPLEPKPVCTEEDGSPVEGFSEHWTIGRKKFGEDYVVCQYYWDGAGVLAFNFPDGSWLVNEDCKKQDEWEYWTQCPF